MFAGALRLWQVHILEVKILREGLWHSQFRFLRLEQSVVVHCFVTCPGLYPLSIQRTDQHIMLHTELLRVNRKDIAIERTGGVTLIAREQANTFDLAK